MITQKYLDALTYEIIGTSIEVHKTMVNGLLESVHHHCLKEELLHRKTNFPQRCEFLWFSGEKKLE